MFEAFIRSCGGSDAVRRFLDSYVQEPTLSACEEATMALRGPQSVGFEVVLLLLLCLQKSGLESEARSLGEQALANPQYPAWDKHLVRIVLGQLTAEDALKALEPTGGHNPILASFGLPTRTMEQRCQAFYYQGARLMWMSPNSDFRQALREAILTAAFGCLEFDLAMAHLGETVSSPMDMAYLKFGNACSKMTGPDCEKQLKQAISRFAELGANRELRVARGILSRIGGSQPRDSLKVDGASDSHLCQTDILQPSAHPGMAADSRSAPDVMSNRPITQDPTSGAECCASRQVSAHLDESEASFKCPECESMMVAKDSKLARYWLGKGLRLAMICDRCGRQFSCDGTGRTVAQGAGLFLEVSGE